MERRFSNRVSEAQWGILIEYLEKHPNLARARGYNNSAQGRAESLRLWQEVTLLLNSEGSGTTKTPKEWSVYISNYKSKLKKIVANINSDANSTGGGPPRAIRLSEWDHRFLGLLGPGFGQTAPRVMVQPFPDEQPSTLATTAEIVLPSITATTAESPIPSVEIEGITQHQNETEETRIQNEPLLPRRIRLRRQRTRPLAPLDEARRILSQIETQRAAADAAHARAHELLAHSIMPIADVARNLGRLADVAEKYLAFIMATANNS